LPYGLLEKRPLNEDNNGNILLIFKLRLFEVVAADVEQYRIISGMVQ